METDWLNSRRSFVKSIILTGIAIQLPWIQSCSNKQENISIPNNIHPLGLKEYLNLHYMLDILFPEDGNGPGALTVKADHYIIWVLNDKEEEVSSRDFFLKNLKKINQESLKKYDLDFKDLDRAEQETFIAFLTEEKWSQNWLSRTITYIFEALLLDPQYKVNPNNIGWKWLEHNPGFPRPTSKQLYPSILNKKHEI